MLAALAYGMKRFALILAAATAACTATGVAWALLRDRPIAHAIGAFLYIGATLIIGTAVGGGSTVQLRSGEASPSWQLQHQQEKSRAISDGFWLIPIGILLIALGFVVQQYL
jgi:hypothetical protein